MDTLAPLGLRVEVIFRVRVSDRVKVRVSVAVLKIEF